MKINLGETFLLTQIFEKFLTLLSKRRAGERSVEGEAARVEQRRQRGEPAQHPQVLGYL